jgi:hypothetical protein
MDFKTLFPFSPDKNGFQKEFTFEVSRIMNCSGLFDELGLISFGLIYIFLFYMSCAPHMVAAIGRLMHQWLQLVHEYIWLYILFLKIDNKGRIGICGAKIPDIVPKDQ